MPRTYRFTALRVATTSPVRPPSLSVSRPASRRPHRRQSPVNRHRQPSTLLQFPAESTNPPPRPHRLHSPTARMRHHHSSVTTPSPLLEDPDPDLDLDLTAPIVDHVAAC